MANNKKPSKNTVLAQAEAKAEQIVNSKSKEKAKGAKSKGKKKNPVAKYFRELKSEFKKVVWPSKKTVINNTFVVLVTMVASAIVVWGLDSAFSALLKLLVDIVK